MAKNKARPTAAILPAADYSGFLGEVVSLLEAARRTSARAVNAVMTATYWEIGHRIVEIEQRGLAQAEYGDELIKRLAGDLTTRFGRGFGWRNLYRMRNFHLAYPETLPTLSAKSGVEKGRQGVTAPIDDVILPTVLAKSLHGRDTPVTAIERLATRFALPWSHYEKLLTIQDQQARQFYETEALRGGWSVRQLDRQISSQFYQRTLLSKNKAAMLRKGTEPQSGDLVTPEEEIKDPLVLEFLNLKDEYSEHDLEEALIHKLEEFLLELGNDFAFMGRQKRLRIGDEWYRIDLLFFHRRLKCLVVIDLKLGKFTHADSGQMHLYLNYAREHWMHKDENPPVGLILCAKKDEAVAHYALEGLPNRVMAAEYRMALPEEKMLTAQLEKTQRALELKAITTETSPQKPTPGRIRKKSDHRPR